MLHQPFKKKKVNRKQVVSPNRSTNPAISYQEVEEVSEQEIQRRLDGAFDIIFDSLDKKLAEQKVTKF